MCQKTQFFLYKWQVKGFSVFISLISHTCSKFIGSNTNILIEMCDLAKNFCPLKKISLDIARFYTFKCRLFTMTATERGPCNVFLYKASTPLHSTGKTLFFRSFMRGLISYKLMDRYTAM